MTTSPAQITDELLDDLQQKAKAATPGPWTDEESSNYPEDERWVKAGEWVICATYGGIDDGESQHQNAAHISAANPAAIDALVEHIRSLTEQLQALRTWRRVDDELPEPGVTVLACYTNSHGKTRRIRAEYVAPKSHEADGVCDEDECNVEYDEETDQYYWKAGWYELLDNWSDYSHLAVTEGDITHWIPLPAAPAIAQEGQSHE